jgi:cytochrome c-type biogenesis protein CcmH/NrfG
LKQYREAEAAYRQSIKLDPTTRRMRTTRSADVSRRGQYDDEVSAYKNAIRLRSDYALRMTVWANVICR